MGNRSYLSRQEKYDLLKFVAATGENYQRYLEWARAKHVENVFSENYFHTWVARRRTILQEERARIRDEVRRMSVYDKDRRLQELERVSEYLLDEMEHMRIHDQCSKTCNPMNMFLKLSEQHRKTMETIARERGEFGKSDQQSDGRDTRALIAKREAIGRLGERTRKVVVIQAPEKEASVGDNQDDVWE